MARIVCTWELGAHLGHISRFASLAEALRQHEHDLSFIFRELHGVRNIFGDNPPHRFFQAPFSTNTVSTSRNPLTYSEILQCNGYFSSDVLLYLIKAWKALFELIKPDLILCDYSPTALLASREMGIPQVELGTGFFIQALESPMPCIISGQTISLQQRQKADNQLLDVINKVLSIESMNPIDHVYDIFSNAQQWLTTYPELDICQHRKEGDYVGILTTMGTGVLPDWNDDNCHNDSNHSDNNSNSNRNDKKTRIFGYLKPSYQKLPDFLEALSHFNVDARLYIPNAPKELVKKYQCESIQFSHTPYDISVMMESCDITVCHAGHNTIAHSLLKSKPLLLIPQYNEQLELTKRVTQHGYGASINANSNTSIIKKVLQSLIQNKQYRNNCQRFSTRYRDMNELSCIDHMTKRCLQLLEPK